MNLFLYFVLQELETRIDTQKQTLQARDESIKKLLEMLQSKGEGEMFLYFFVYRTVLNCLWESDDVRRPRFFALFEDAAILFHLPPFLCLGGAS